MGQILSSSWREYQDLLFSFNYLNPQLRLDLLWCICAVHSSLLQYVTISMVLLCGYVRRSVHHFGGGHSYVAMHTYCLLLGQIHSRSLHRSISHLRRYIHSRRDYSGRNIPLTVANHMASINQQRSKAGAVTDICRGNIVSSFDLKVIYERLNSKELPAWSLRVSVASSFLPN